MDVFKFYAKVIDADEMAIIHFVHLMSAMNEEILVYKNYCCPLKLFSYKKVLADSNIDDAVIINHCKIK